jgi:hypothetical protein
MTAFMLDDPGGTPNPVATLIELLYQRLALDDPPLRGIANGFRLTGTSGPGSGPMRLWHLDEVFGQEVFRLLPSRGMSRGDSDWATAFM